MVFPWILWVLQTTYREIPCPNNTIHIHIITFLHQNYPMTYFPFLSGNILTIQVAVDHKVETFMWEDGCITRHSMQWDPRIFQREALAFIAHPRHTAENKWKKNINSCRNYATRSNDNDRNPKQHCFNTEINMELSANQTFLLWKIHLNAVIDTGKIFHRALGEVAEWFLLAQTRIQSQISRYSTHGTRFCDSSLSRPSLTLHIRLLQTWPSGDIHLIVAAIDALAVTRLHWTRRSNLSLFQLGSC